MAVYAAQVSAVDRGVGRMLAAIRDLGIEENTLVMFLSDNGAAPDGGVHPTAGGFGFASNHPNDTWRLDGMPIRPGSGPNNMPGPHDTFAAYGIAWATVSNTPLRGTKLTAYEGGIRTPLIVRWPSVIQQGGKLSSEVGHVIDILPTCLDVAGADYPSKVDQRRPLPLQGKTLAPIFRGERREGHEALCWSVPRNQAIRMGRWKLVNAGRGQPWQLYDLEADGSETRDLANSDPQRVEDMVTRWETWAQRCNVKD
jgi:arylsulfatase